MLVYQRVPYECVIGITVCLYMSILFWGKKSGIITIWRIRQQTRKMVNPIQESQYQNRHGGNGDGFFCTDLNS